MALCIDLHVHTSFSYDGISSVGEVLRAAVAKGLDGIAICDHDTTAGARAAVRYVEDVGLELLVIPGIEVSTSEGHLLVLGVEEWTGRKLSPKEAIKVAKKKGGVVIAPHPFHPFRHSLGTRILKLNVDAVEAFNSRCITGFTNMLAAAVARRLQKPVVAGSDAHCAECVGLAFVILEAVPTVDSVLRALLEAQGKVEIHYNKTPVSTYLSQVRRGFKRRRSVGGL
ncbi:CehA/McbA family metallohydrolase [Candidatus Alkanophaga liquidiphilum]